MLVFKSQPSLLNKSCHFYLEDNLQAHLNLLLSNLKFNGYLLVVCEVELISDILVFMK